MTMSRHLVALSVVGVLALSLAGCAGSSAEDDSDDALEVNDGTTSQALSSPDPGAGGATNEPDDDKSECNERDHERHHHHRHHKFKVLDRLDGVKDHQITIASLPAGLPERLTARLHELDANGDGVVTKPEAKKWLHRKDHGPKPH